MRRHFGLLMLVALLVALLPAAASAHTEDDPLYAKLMAGQTEYVGHVIIWNDGNDLHVTFQAKYGIGFCLNETHLHVATDWTLIPQNNGNPTPGQFDYKDDELGCVHTKEYVIPLDWPVGQELALAAHAVVGRWDDPYWEETGWGVICGHFEIWGFPGANWAAWIPYTVQ